MKEEKISCPMFPRLHVNDKEKGGPRAPPRNKMALYEQLSIPSQRPNPSKVNSQLSLSEDQHINTCFRFAGQQSNSSLTIGPQKFPLSRTNRGPHASHHADKQRKLINKDDFVVPVFEADQAYCNMGNSLTVDHSPPGDESINIGATNKSCFNKFEDSPASNKIKHTTVDQHGDNSAKHKFSEGAFLKNQDANAVNNNTGQTCIIENHNKNTYLAMSTQLKSDLSAVKFCKRTIVDDDDGSEASTTDSASGIVISTDNIVKVIGKENFWKARSMITKQHRTFMTQLFELHKLIKVQQMLAEDPDILLEETINEQSKTTYIQQEQSVCEPPKKLPLTNNITSPLLPFPFNSEKLNENSESLKRKTIEAEPSPQTANTAESQWAFPHPLGHQWLVPVMSPSEGLVYKPYSFPVCNGCGNMESNTHHHNYGMIPCGAPYSAISPYGMIPSTSGSVVDQSNMNGSNDVSSRRSGTQAQVMKFGRSNETHLMASTASSSFQGEVGFLPVDGTNNHQRKESAKVIKAVPRNRKSATVSAVRIFESIQEERKRSDGI